ncbi:MAG: hypothetical protein KDD70_17540 [Bdellovibrionales bacterium]|nr:hypothetical protein [Bdellovibrionales bacterium]
MKINISSIMMTFILSSIWLSVEFASAQEIFSENVNTLRVCTCYCEATIGSTTKDLYHPIRNAGSSGRGSTSRYRFENISQSDCEDLEDNDTTCQGYWNLDTETLTKGELKRCNWTLEYQPSSGESTLNRRENFDVNELSIFIEALSGPTK